MLIFKLAFEKTKKSIHINKLAADSTFLGRKIGDDTGIVPIRFLVHIQGVSKGHKICIIVALPMLRPWVLPLGVERRMSCFCSSFLLAQL